MIQLQAHAWTAITAANPLFAGDPGLADRLLNVRMARQNGDTADELLSREIEANRNSALSHIAYTLQAALANTAPVQGKLNARHPDWAVFAIRVGRALGIEKEAIEALQMTEADKAVLMTESNDIIDLVLRFLREKGDCRFVGTSKDLHRQLIAFDDDWANPRKNFSSKKLSKQILAAWPHLSKIIYCRKEVRHANVTTWTFDTDLNCENAEPF